MSKTNKIHNLSKSDFIVATSCPKKLHYKKMGYPTNNSDNEFLKMLAEGGYVVGKLAQMHYPEGIEVTGTREEALETTAKLLEQDEVVLFEPAFLSNQKFVRIDILKKKGNKFELIEVKSKSYDSTSAHKDFLKRKKNGEFANKEYIYDAIYQTVVLQEVYLIQKSIPT